MKVKDIFKDWKVIVLLIFLFIAYLTINPQFGGNEGVTIRSVGFNSSAAQAGVPNPSADLTPLQKEKIISIKNKPVNNEEDYYQILSTLQANRSVKVVTNKFTYTLLTSSEDPTDLGLRIYNAPTSNLRKGLDLEGGTRVLLKPVEEISEEDLDSTIRSIKERLNVYGLSDLVVRPAVDLAGAQFIVIEIAGVTEDEVRELIAQQGKFEARIGNETVFFGGKKDITYVCRSSQCSGVGLQQPCATSGSQSLCFFSFSITLTQEAAERQAAITDKLTVLSEQGSNYLSEDLDLILDDRQVDSLRIGAELKGRATTQIQISGSGSGATQEDAYLSAEEQMKKLQTIIITGSLPVKLDIVKLDTVSPSLGKEFLDNILLVGLLVIIVVVGVVLIRYKNMKIVIPMVATLLSEMVLILGFAALFKSNLDLPSIAGVIVVAGTGVDHLIIITDETLKGGNFQTWAQKIKSAMTIVFGAYFTTLVGMLPLFWAGAGLLKGFALTTIVGISFGVLIARPAYASVIEKMLK